jgi:hypothetical protein
MRSPPRPPRLRRLRRHFWVTWVSPVLSSRTSEASPDQYQGGVHAIRSAASWRLRAVDAVSPCSSPACWEFLIRQPTARSAARLVPRRDRRCPAEPRGCGELRCIHIRNSAFTGNDDKWRLSEWPVPRAPGRYPTHLPRDGPRRARRQSVAATQRSRDGKRPGPTGAARAQEAEQRLNRLEWPAVRTASCSQ